MEDLKGVHLVEKGLGALHVSATILQFADVLKFKSFKLLLVSFSLLGDSFLGNDDPVVIEGCPLMHGVLEDVSGLHDVKNTLGTLHVGTAVLELVGVLESQLSKRFFVGLEFSELFMLDLDFGGVYPVFFEFLPVGDGPGPEDLVFLHDVEGMSNALHVEATTLKFLHKL